MFVTDSMDRLKGKQIRNFLPNCRIGKSGWKI